MDKKKSVGPRYPSVKVFSVKFSPENGVRIIPVTFFKFFLMLNSVKRKVVSFLKLQKLNCI